MVLSWARQVAALAKKELLLLLRAPKKSVTELVAPVLVVVLLGILNVSVSYPSPEVGTQAIDRLASDARGGGLGRAGGSGVRLNFRQQTDTSHHLERGEAPRAVGAALVCGAWVRGVCASAFGACDR